MKWFFRKITDFCDTGSGGTPSRRKADLYYGGDIPWIKSGELNDSVLFKTDETITNKGLEESSAKLVPAGSILIAMYGATVGKTAFLGINATTNQAICNIQPNPEIIENNFLWYFLKSNIKELLQKRVGGAQPNISQQIIKEIKAPIPPISEQRRIVEILEQADRLRNLRTDADAKAQRILPALFIQMFGDPATNPMRWDTVLFNEVVEIGTQLVDPNQPDFLDLPHIGGEHIEKETGRILSPPLVKDSNLLSNKFKFSSDHILLSKIRPYLNKVAYPRFYGVCSADIYPLRPIKNNVTHWYLVSLLRTQAFLDYAKAHSDRLRIPKLNKAQLGAFEFPLPDPHVMVAFDERVEKIISVENFRFALQEKIETLYQVILYRAFTGDLTTSWREAHMKELLQEMEIQAKALAS